MLRVLWLVWVGGLACGLACGLSVGLDGGLGAGLGVDAAAQPQEMASRLALETDGDDRWETPLFYALLNEAAGWGAGQSLMPRIADPVAIEADAAAYRGQVFRLDGYLQQAERVALTRAAPAYGDAVTRWAVLVSEADGGSADQVVLVYLLDPAGDLARHPPSARRTVQLEAQFFKLMALPALTGKVELFPVFVGRVAEGPGGPVSPKPTSGGHGGGLVWIVGGVGIGLAGLWLVRGLKNRDRARRLRRGEGKEPAVLVRSDLPDDPAEALGVLARETSDTQTLDTESAGEPG